MDDILAQTRNRTSRTRVLSNAEMAQRNRATTNDTMDYMMMNRAQRDATGMGLSREAGERAREDYLDIGRRAQDMRMREERNLMPERIARMQEDGKGARTQMEVQGRTDVAGIEADSARDVQSLRGDAARDVADTQAGASRYNSTMGAIGDVAGAVGGVVGGWLQRGIEKIRQNGETERLDRLLGASGMKDGGVYQDATGRGVPVPEPEPAKPLSALGKLNADFRAGLIDEKDYNAERSRLTQRGGSSMPPMVDGDMSQSDGPNQDKAENRQQTILEDIRKNIQMKEQGDDRYGLNLRSRATRIKSQVENLIQEGYQFPRPKTPEEAKKLPSGTVYLDPQGNPRLIP